MLPRPLGVVHPVYVYTAKIYNVSYESIRTAVNGPLTAARAGHEPREIRSDTKDRTSVKNPFFSEMEYSTGTTDHSTYNRPTSPVRGPHEYSVASMWLKGHSNPGNPANPEKYQKLVWSLESSAKNHPYPLTRLCTL